MTRERDFLSQLEAISYDPFLVVDSERRVTHFNEPFALMLGLRSAQRRKVIGAPFDELLALDEMGQACIADSLRLDDNVRVQSVTAHGPDGRELVLDMSALPLRDEQDRVIGVLVLHRDVTDEHHLKERYTREKQEHLSERESLLRIINDRDEEIRKLKKLGR